MKKSLIVLCAAGALVAGCNKDQGAADSDRNQNTGFGSSRDATYPSSGTMTRDTNTLGSGSASATNANANTNTAVGAPGTSSGQSSGTSGSGTQPPRN
jgi:hypothetical protein